MTLSDQQFKFLKDVALLVLFAASKGWKVTGGELQRTEKMQEIYWEAGKTQTMNSLHLDKLAIDLFFFHPESGLTWDKDELQQFGDFWESLSERNEWGGNWESLYDAPHFQRNKV